MTEVIRLDRGHNDLIHEKLHREIATAADALDCRAWLNAMRRLVVRENWHIVAPPEIRVTKALYDRLYLYQEPVLHHLAGELLFRGVPLVPYEE